MNDGNVTSRVEYFYAFPFEKNFDILGGLRSCAFFYKLACVSAPVYLLLLYAGQVYMRNRPAYDLRPALVLWNVALSLFSTWGSLRLVPELFHVLKHFGFRYSVCVDVMVLCNPVTQFWYYAYVLSKFLELGDTVFLVLRRKTVIFLHWFHHCSVLGYTVLLYDQRVMMGRWLTCMNYTVHSFMYAYFALRAAGWRLPGVVSVFVTACQIAQMLAALYICLRVFLFRFLDEQPCSITGTVLCSTMFLFLVYFCLFLNFFYRAYLKRFLVPSRAKKE